jgi:NitT/TauT family transport system permease protein
MNLHLSASNAYRQLKPNGWDVVAFPLILCLIALFVTGFHQTLQPIASLKTEVISLDPIMLPEYALRTLRMLVAMLAALLFTLVYGTLAARSRRAEKSSSRCSISCNPCRYWVISLLP